VERHAGLRAELTRSLSAGYPRGAVLEAVNGRTALALARTAQPDVILMDLILPGAQGLAVLRRLRRAAPRARIAVLSAYDEAPFRACAAGAGAAAFLAKGQASEEILATVAALLKPAPRRERKRPAR